MFGAEMGKFQNLSAKNSQYCSSEKLLYIAWACFRRAIINSRFFLYFFRSTVESHEILKFGNRPCRGPAQSGKLAEYRDLEDRVFPRCCCCKWEEINAGTNARKLEPNFLRIILVLDVHIWR